MSKFYILFCCLFCIVVASHAQEITVSGRVVSDGNILAGVIVSVKNKATQGAITDKEGRYRLRVGGNETLVFSFQGYETVEEPVDNRSAVDAELKKSALQLDEIVITVPYGTVKKSVFTGSAEYISGKHIEKSQVSNISKALEGTVAGLQSFSQSGQPGSDATIRIRGIGSVNASNNPLYVVDGAPYDGNLSSLASSDIESVSVLKDAASAALYGSRAGNGVIIITTKSGKYNTAASVEITSKFGFSSRAQSDYKQLNTDRYFELFWEAVRNNRLDNGLGLEAAAAYASENIVKLLGINPYGTANSEPVGYDGKLKANLRPLWDDNWTDALSQNAHYRDINAQINGGGSNLKYFFSLGSLNDRGTAVESGFERYTLRFNLTSDIRKWLQAGINASGTYSVQDYPKQDDSNTANIFLAARSIPSFYPVYERNPETGEYLTDPETGERIFDYGKYRPGSFGNQNLLGSMPHDIHRFKRDAASVRGYIRIEPVANLTFRSSLNVDYNNRIDHNYANPLYGSDAETGGYVSKSDSRTTGMTYNNLINYTAQINDRHKIHLLAGQEYYEYNYATFGGTREKIIMDGFYEPDAASRLSSFSGSSDRYKLLSFLSSAEYSFDNKYFLSASVRSDGSSRFKPEKRWGTFYSAGASWKITEEPFLAAAKAKGLSDLTLRASYGAQGNDNLSTYYAYQALYSIYNNLGESGLRPSRLATPDLTWETNLNTNIGLDFGIFHNRLTGSVEYFERRSKDLLFNKTLVPSSGFSSTTANIGALKNYGWEITLNGTPVLTKNWKWTLSFNTTTYRNEIVSLPSEVMWSGQKKWVEGGSLYDFYLVEWAGVNPTNGKAQWYHYDKNGEKKKTDDYSSVTTDDKVKSGSSLPDFSGGFQSDISYKGFELSAQFSYVLGGKIYNRDKQMIQHLGNSAGRAWSADMLNRWTPENPNTDIPRLSTVQSSSYTSESSLFLIDRSYLRLKTVTFSYDLPQKWLQAITLKKAVVFVQAENILTVTEEQGLDPEQTFDGTTYWRYPAMKTISFGFNVEF